MDLFYTSINISTRAIWSYYYIMYKTLRFSLFNSNFNPREDNCNIDTHMRSITFVISLAPRVSIGGNVYVAFSSFTDRIVA